MGYLSDYCFFNSGNECPRAFQLWSALSVLGTVVSRKVKMRHGSYFEIYPNLYVALVGDAGSGKSTARKFAKKLVEQNFHDIPLSASIQSREDIVQIMGMPENLRTFKDEKGVIHEYHPYFIIINEMANYFNSADMNRMVEFLVDIYDEDHFSSSFKKDIVKAKIPNPFVSVLACVQPTWIMTNLKIDLFSGGLGRRLILVCDKKEKYIADPQMPEGAIEAYHRVVLHLREAAKLVGTITLTPDAFKWFKSWYEDQSWRNKEDPILKSFHETKHMNLFKVAMLLSLDTTPFTMQVTEEHLRTALAMLDLLEGPVTKLSLGIGRNETANVAVQIMDTLSTCQGTMPEKRLRAMFFSQCRLVGQEFDAILTHLQKTDQIKLVSMVDSSNVTRTYVMLPAAYEATQKKLAEAVENKV